MLQTPFFKIFLRVEQQGIPFLFPFAVFLRDKKENEVYRRTKFKLKSKYMKREMMLVLALNSILWFSCPLSSRGV